MTAQPSMASSVIPVSPFSLVLGAARLVAWSRSKVLGSAWNARHRASSLSSATSPAFAAVSMVPPTSSASYVSSRSSSSESNAARADKMAAFLGAVARSARMSSAVLEPPRLPI